VAKSLEDLSDEGGLIPADPSCPPRLTQVLAGESGGNEVYFGERAERTHIRRDLHTELFSENS
jgi:hypothetical protein